MAVLVPGETAFTDPAASRSHPLDPLSAAEIEAASAAIASATGLAPSARFVYICLYEPAKADVIAFEPGGPAPARLVKVVLRERAERASYEGIVGLLAPCSGRSTARAPPAKSPGERVLEKVPGVQPSVMFEEFLAAEEIVRADPRWQEAMRTRGVTDFSLCMIDPWSAPNVAPGLGPQDGRFVRPLTWVRSAPGRQRLRPPGRGPGRAGRPRRDDGRRRRGPRRRPAAAHPGNYSRRAH